MSAEGQQRLPIAPGADRSFEIPGRVVPQLHKREGGLDPIQDGVEVCYVGLKVNYGRVGLRKNLRDEGSRPI